MSETKLAQSVINLELQLNDLLLILLQYTFAKKRAGQSTYTILEVLKTDSLC